MAPDVDVTALRASVLRFGGALFVSATVCTGGTADVYNAKAKYIHERGSLAVEAERPNFEIFSSAMADALPAACAKYDLKY
jgi:hypothetical protein